ncbi:benzoate-CoA ligase family protein [Acidobacteria bacterium AH-259-D05]|nr:benzoate-CoA ligase family protein [Acidobacteria bacterium AH-259-D05]
MADLAKTIQVPKVFNQAEFLVDRHLQEGRGHRPVIYFQDRMISYEELAAMVNRSGNALLSLGVSWENRVLIALSDRPEFAYCYLGAMKIGAVPVPVNPFAPKQDFQYYLNDSRASVAVVDPQVLPKIEAVRNDLKHLQHLVLLDGQQPGVTSYESLVARVSDELQAARTSRDDMSFWMYTSGTTGTPKGVVHLHHDLPNYMPPHCSQVVGITEDDLSLSTSKLFFSYGRNNSLESPLLAGSSVILFSDRPEPKRIFELIQQYCPTLFYSVPSTYSALLREIDETGRSYDLGSLRRCVSAGEALPKGLFDRWKQTFGLEIMDGVGSTDVGAIYLSNQPGQVKPGSSGKMLRGFEGKLLDDEGCELPSGQAGTLWVKNDGIAAFYWHKHQQTKEVFRGDWFNTGDQFYKDEEGYYWYLGRRDDMFKASGMWVAPTEVEGVLLDHPSVSEAAVIGVPDDSGLEKPMAFVVLKSGKPTSTLEVELRTYVEDRLAHFKTPCWIRFVDELPRTVTGKVQRHKLRAIVQGNSS